MEVQQKNNLAVPVAIVIAGALIAGAVIFTNNKPVATTPATVQKADIKIRDVTATDHILGNPKAEIVVVEYSDFECPYCQVFHTAMKQIMDEYGTKGKVAWVYRNFWAERKTQTGQIFHPHGGVAAEAGECVAELGGNEKFWSFANTLLESQQTQTEKIKDLSALATSIGIEKGAFDACASSRKYKDAVQKEYDEAVKLGISGTPTSFLVSKAGTFPIEGALPYAELKKAIEQVLDLN